MEKQTQDTRKAPRTETGMVVSNKMQQTVVVSVLRTYRHPVYEKFLRRQVTYKAHDAKNECKVGDRVTISETRPVSKTKRWKVSRIVVRAKE